MKASLEKTDLSSKAEVEMIHKALYCFSNIKLHNLLRKNQAFRFIISDSINKKDQIFNFEENSDEKLERNRDQMNMRKN